MHPVEIKYQENSMKTILRSYSFAITFTIVILPLIYLPFPAFGQITVTPPSYEFPPQQVGSSSQPLQFVITNTGTEEFALHPGHISLAALNGQTTSLSLLTINIWFDQDNWPARFAYMLEEIREMDPDIIGMQEVIQRATLDNQAQQMADSLGYYYYFDSVDPEDRDQRFGNAILSRFPIEETNFRALVPLDAYRKVVHVRVNVDGNSVDVYNTHLHNPAEATETRSQQITDMRDFIAQTSSGGPVFVMGDFNANPDWPEMDLMYEIFTDVYPLFHQNHLDPEHGTLNYHKGHQQRRIDYVFFDNASSNDLMPLSAEIVLDQPNDQDVYASDHFGVFAEFSILSDASDFELDNLEEEVILQPEDTTSVNLIFQPRTTGEKSIILHVADVEVPVSGESFDATIRSFPWSEDFTDIPEFGLPLGWVTNAENWYVFNSGFSGGENPELVFWWEPVGEGTFYVSTPPMETTGLDSMNVSFKHYIDNFQDPGIYDLRLISMVDGQEYLILEWEDPDDVPAEEISVRINSNDHGVGSERLHLAWVFAGSSDNISRWTIDDIIVDAMPSLQVTPGSWQFDAQQLSTASDSVVFTFTNIGGGELTVAPEDILIEGTDAMDFQLVNIADTVRLGNQETAEVSVIFTPSETGNRTADLRIGEVSILLQGEGFDPTITELPWEENFSDVIAGELPLGWSTDSENWGAFNSGNAGGESPEMVFWWQPEVEGRFYLITPQIETAGFSELYLSFKYRVRNFGDPGLYTLSVIAIADGEEFIIEEWVDPPFIQATEFSGLITSEDHRVGSDEFQLAWVFDGITNNISSWDIDDIRLGDVPVGIFDEQGSDVPDEFALSQNYPNPFNPVTNIRYQVPEHSRVTIEVFNVTGQRVATLLNEDRQPGYHTVTFNGNGLASGVYLYRMQAGNFRQTMKFLLIK
jgi:endonuclease/exonuclease/phosphatase family metal-dependent hydrolase